MKKIVQKILRTSLDPLGVRKSTSLVFDKLKLIEVDYEKIKEIARLINEKIDKRQLLTQEQFGNENPSPQLIFILDAINYCFWAKKGAEKWTVEYPRGNFISNGWFALVASIERARTESVPILDAEYLKSISLSDVKHIFRSSNSTQIPLLSSRAKFLREIGKILSEKYNGDIYNLLVEAGLDAGLIAKKVVDSFPCFLDPGFYKRAQIFAYDIGLLSDLKVKNLKCLTAFADYKIPQILRAFGIFRYKPELAKKVDNYVVLKSGSREEIEIRSATIWACELTAKEIGVEPALVDNVLWKMSQSLKDVKPYHRVLSTNY